MTYQEFIKQYGIHLYEGTELTPLMLANGWQWWSKQPYANEGLCRDKHTGNFCRYTTHAEKRNRLQAKLLKNKFTTQSGLVAGIVKLQWVYR